MHNGALATALCDLVAAALPIVSEVSEQMRTLGVHQVRWVAEAHGFIRQAVPLTVPEHLDPSATTRIAALPQYSQARTILLADPACAKLVGKHVGGPFVMSSFSPDHVLTDFILRASARLHELAYEEGIIRETWEPIEAAIHEPAIEYVAVAPLLGVALEDGLERMKLGPDVSVARLSDQEVLRCLEAEILLEVGQNVFGKRIVSRDEVPSTGIRVVTAYKKGIHQIDMSPEGHPVPVGPSEGDVAHRWLFLSSVHSALTALRLHKPGFVSVPAVGWWSDNYFARHGAGWDTREHAHPHPWFQPAGYFLAGQEALGLAELCAALVSDGVQQRPALQLALRRLDLAVDRTRDDDRLLDLLICAEALLLQDIGSEQRTEMRFRVSLRAGRSFDSRQYSPREVFRIMKSAYDARSAIVHGSKPRDLRLPGLGKVQLREFTAAVEEVMREGARAIVLRASTRASTQPLIDPDETVLSE